jgi:peptidylprolyl isomerase
MQSMNINYIIGVFVLAALGWLGYVVFQGDEVKSKMVVEENKITNEISNLATNTEVKEVVNGEIKNAKNIESKKVETKFMKQDKYKVTMNTNYGAIVLELDGKTTPITAGSFAENAKNGYYNGIKFHRVIRGFMLQGGDPNTKDDSRQDIWGQGGVGSKGTKFNDENFTLSNVPGTISMANAGPNTNGSQFFINTGNNVFLNGKHTVFGKVISGMEIVTKIENVKTIYPGQLDRPEQPVIINSATVE